MKLIALTLQPDLAKIGTEIRVLGNNDGQKLSILTGVIGRLDANAPCYGHGYNDFNTNYIQVAASLSGGSSGSPVVNVDGDVVALQAGYSLNAATNFFLPLDRPLRALEMILKDQFITRGTIQTQWITESFRKCQQLGLSSEYGAELRAAFPKETGLLVAKTVLPKGPADGLIEVGDILIKINGKLLTQFVSLDELLDSHVGQKIQILVQRGEQDVEVELMVQNLHDITPDKFVTISGGIFHDISYQQARLYNLSLSGVYMSSACGTFETYYDHSRSAGGYLVSSIQGQEVPNLAKLISIMKEIPDQAKVVFEYKIL